MPKPFKYSVEVRFRDCDLLGHVNNAVYFTYLEQARTGFLKAHGYDVRDFKKSCPVILAHASCDFKSPAYTGEILDVHITVSEVKNASFTFSYEVKDQATGRLIATAKTVIVTYDYDKKKVIPIPKEMRERMLV